MLGSTASGFLIAHRSRLQRSGRAVLAALLACLVAFSAAAPVWASAPIENPAAALSIGSPLNEAPVSPDSDEACPGFHGSHCHHQADRQATHLVASPVVLAAAAIFAGGSRNLASLPPAPIFEPPRS